jgi:hypothetical protein
MSGVRDIGKIMDSRLRPVSATNPSIYSPMRTCTGPCRTRKSIRQFTGDSPACNQCVRRAPVLHK